MLIYIAISYLIIGAICIHEYMSGQVYLWSAIKVFLFAPIALPIIVVAVFIKWLFS